MLCNATTSRLYIAVLHSSMQLCSFPNGSAQVLYTYCCALLVFVEFRGGKLVSYVLSNLLVAALLHQHHPAGLDGQRMSRCAICSRLSRFRLRT